MSKKLLIVESPTKARTISKFLDSSFKIEASYGHVRDLPQRELGVEVENDFAPKYVIFRQNQKRLTALKKLAQKMDQVYFATDEDREGEAIAWHLIKVLDFDKSKNLNRIAFHEITQSAIEEALKNPREIDMALVNAQQARRILDRLVGYKLSPFLWKKVVKGLSAGRVQSVAVRLVAERQREIDDFKPEEYWGIEAQFRAKKSKKEEDIFLARLYSQNNKPLKKLEIKSKEQAEQITQNLKQAEYKIINLENKQIKKNPLPPFTTSTLQQAGNSHFNFSTKQTMLFAQQLYEGIELEKTGSTGLITYMRTDSLNLAEKFIAEARDFIKKDLGENYLPPSGRHFKTKSKLAQEAHEAIRPTNIFLTPEKVKNYLSEQQFKLYTLIWQRALSCQMAEAILNATVVDIAAEKTPYVFRANGSTIKFDGFLKIYPQKTEENFLPNLSNEEILDLLNLKSEQHFTIPPAHYSEATLVKALEEYGIGRPSTYAPTISTILERNYVIKEEKKLKPTEIGILVNDLLVKHFPQVVDYQFTAKMENDLDEVAQGQKDWVKLLKDFYQPFMKNLEQKDKELSKKDIAEEKTNEKCPNCQSPLIIKMGRFGKFMACSDFPQCKFTKPLKGEEKEEAQLTTEKCPECQNNLVIKHGRFGQFLACSNYPQCKFTKKILKSLGIKCPQCDKGEIVSKKTKTGRFFYACSDYPQCKFSLWSKPTGEKCPACNSLLVYGAKNTLRCSKKECKFEKNI